jgi:5-methylcytosine-specific restriction endonuclease McrA
MAYVRPTVIQCERCGIDVAVAPKGRIPRFHDRRCRLGQHPSVRLTGVCPFCSEAMRGNARTCGERPCVREDKRISQAAYFKAKGGNPNRYPGADKLAEERYGPLRERYPETFRKNDARHCRLRRARLAGAECESFDHADVYARDGWICGICTEHVDSAIKWPAPFSASLDHIVPLSKGGPHTRANTQLAHLACNMQKGATLSAEEVA